jgi:hypothetical protein
VRLGLIGRRRATIETYGMQRLLALTEAIWHNHHSREPVLRSLTAYDH